ncbi:MAG: efflux RND transporter periplasmic adaptor subunit [Acidobacteria bacterium]|nr:efflux RND transporter periplasmic adaptor subunit [Acidobacteriota bacterium]
MDGIVISRNVDPGQTVAASMSAPTLYVIAADLTQMQVLANIDEADVGRMRPGQTVRFRVDAYPTDEFTGSVQQVRLQPAVVQNVVTYSTVISVPNPELKLKPGMTANVSIEIARRNNVLRVPNAALRFRPTEAIFAALNQPVPPELQRGAGRGQTGGGRAGATGAGQAPATHSGQPTQPTAGGAPAAGSPAPQRAPQSGGGAAATPQGRGSQGAPQQPRADSPEARGGGDTASAGRGSGGGRGFDPNMTPEERRKRMEERMAGMTPEQREQLMARMREREAPGGSRGDGTTASADGGGRGQAATANAPSNTAGGRREPNRGMVQGVNAGSSIASGATTIDSLFGPLPVSESRGRVWLYLAATKQLKPVNVRLGISDGTYTEVLDGELQPGQEIVSNVVTGLEPAQRPGQQGAGQNPLIPQRALAALEDADGNAGHLRQGPRQDLHGWRGHRPGASWR